MKDIGKGIASLAIMGGATTAVVVAHETMSSSTCGIILIVACLACVALFKDLSPW